jgi:hypothetical protein
MDAAVNSARISTDPSFHFSTMRIIAVQKYLITDQVDTTKALGLHITEFETTSRAL